MKPGLGRLVGQVWSLLSWTGVLATGNLPFQVTEPQLSSPGVPQSLPASILTLHSFLPWSKRKALCPCVPVSLVSLGHLVLMLAVEGGDHVWPYREGCALGSVEVLSTPEQGLNMSVRGVTDLPTLGAAGTRARGNGSCGFVLRLAHLIVPLLIPGPATWPTQGCSFPTSHKHHVVGVGHIHSTGHLEWSRTLPTDLGKPQPDGETCRD